MKTPLDETLSFLELVSNAAVANPFGEQRTLWDRQLSEQIPGKYKAADIPFAIARHTEKIISELFSSAQNVQVNLSQDIQNKIKEAALFALFHKYAHEFDDHIQKQNTNPGSNLSLDCGPRVYADLKAITESQVAAHLVGLFFQMRRAYFFITRSLHGESEPIVRLREHLWRTLFTHDLRLYMQTMHARMESFSILLLGETGVGKSQIAAALGRSAYIPFNAKENTFAASFLDIHLAANISEYPETLIESELFGHRKGSFTGALDNYSGLLGETHPNGMLFLDEIGELSPPVQVKLLRVLQERVYSPVGSHDQRRFSGRLIAATNANIFEKISNNEFRSDLFYRLASDVIEIPTLRSRLKADPREKALLVQRILHRLMGDVPNHIQEATAHRVLEALPKEHTWPGNLREFEQTIRGLILHGQEPHKLLKPQLSEDPNRRARFPEGWTAARWTADEMLAHYTRHAFEKLGSYEKVAHRLDMDWRTVKKWVTMDNL